MRFLASFVTYVCVCSISMCYAGGITPSFRVLIVHEKGTAHGMHEIDAKDMKKTFKSVADAIKWPIYVTQMECSKTSLGKIRKWCSTITPLDTTVVYYSGPNLENHMYNGSWPLIKIGKNSIDVDQMAHMVRLRKARLSLVFVDCYNKCLKPNNIIRRFYGHPLEKIKKKKIRQKMKSVWLSEKGFLTMCSNKNGAESYGVFVGRNKFGAFTEALLLAISGWTDECADVCEMSSRTHGHGNAHRMRRLPHVHCDALKISGFSQRICCHMQEFAFSKENSQVPFFQAAIMENK
jgi:hypothetical protein